MCEGPSSPDIDSSLDVSHGTIKDLTLQTRPALCASKVNLSASHFLTGCDYIDIQAHSRLHNQNAGRMLPENCHGHGGCFQSIFHFFCFELKAHQNREGEFKAKRGKT